MRDIYAVIGEIVKILRPHGLNTWVLTEIAEDALYMAPECQVGHWRRLNAWFEARVREGTLFSPTDPLAPAWIRELSDIVEGRRSQTVAAMADGWSAHVDRILSKVHEVWLAHPGVPLAEIVSTGADRYPDALGWMSDDELVSLLLEAQRTGRFAMSDEIARGLKAR